MEAVGTLTDIFPLPVCTSFRKRFLEGRLCYEFDPRHLKVDVDRATAQKVGLSLLVDVNAEYDLKKLFSEPEEKIFQDINDEFFRLENSEEIEIQIDTISKCLTILFSNRKPKINIVETKTFFELFINFSFFTCRPRACEAVRRGELRDLRRAGGDSYRELPRHGPEYPRLS